MNWNRILKSPRFVPFGANLSQLWDKCELADRYLCQSAHSGPVCHVLSVWGLSPGGHHVCHRSQSQHHSQCCFWISQHLLFPLCSLYISWFICLDSLLSRGENACSVTAMWNVLVLTFIYLVIELCGIVSCSLANQKAPWWVSWENP